MNSKNKKIEDLDFSDFEISCVWEFVNNDTVGETHVRPIRRLPVTSLSGKVVASKVDLANGNLMWALLGNIDSKNARLNEHFLTLSVPRDGKWFTLSRYHDFDYREKGPAALAKFLGLNVGEIFPISYNISQLAVGNSEALAGKILKEPREKLARSQIIALAVP